MKPICRLCRSSPASLSKRIRRRAVLESQLEAAIAPPKTNAANERMAKHLRNHRHDRWTFVYFPGLDATNWPAELAIRFGVVLRKVWGSNRTWIGAQAQAVLMSVRRTCRQRGHHAVDFLSPLLRQRSPTLTASPP